MILGFANPHPPSHPESPLNRTKIALFHSASPNINSVCQRLIKFYLHWINENVPHVHVMPHFHKAKAISDSNVANAPFPYSDSDVIRYRVSLLSMRVFPHSDSDSDWVQYPFLSDSDSDVCIFNRASLSLSGNRPSDSNSDAAFAIAMAITVWKRAIRKQYRTIAITVAQWKQS